KILECAGRNGVLALARVLRSVYSNGDGLLSRCDIQNGLRDIGLRSSAHETKEAISALFSRCSGGEPRRKISMKVLLKRLMGAELGQERENIGPEDLTGPQRAMISQVFNALDHDGDGYVSLKDLRRRQVFFNI
ncbi:unnamed protein product, partial [Choristocarpus tenellus]